MFYADIAERTVKNLRLGDIVTGYVIAIPSQPEPITKSFVNYNIDVKLPSYLVVLTPCCSIGDRSISLVPLLSIKDKKRKSFFENPNFRKDMTLINRPHTLEDWRKLGHNDVTEDGSNALLYTYDNLFIYAEDQQLNEYTINVKGEEISSRYYVIDFKDIGKVKCDCILDEKEENKSYYKDRIKKTLDSKILELSIDTRSTLRDKLAFYFHRPAKEDL